MKKKIVNEESNNTERWLLTYADLITLLLGLFVILYAMSKIDSDRYTKMVSAFGGVFGKTEQSELVQNIYSLNSNLPDPKVEKFALIDKINGSLSDAVRSGMVSVSENERGITIHVLEKLLFESGSDELKTSSLNVLDMIAGELKKIPNDIRVEGHTDNVPIQTMRFPSNWHLSVSRAANTAYYLIYNHNLTPEKIAVAGYSEYHSIAPNTSAESRAKNRRVDIVIVTNLVSDENDEKQKTNNNQ